MITSRADRPLVALRADAGAGVGLGHVRRCLALAAALAPRATARLLVPADRPAHAVVRAAGSEPIAVGAGLDAVLASARALGADVLVVDSYALGAETLARARGEVSVVAVVDDGGRFPIDADVVVNGALGLAPPAAPGDTDYLLGPAFALLAPEFAAAVVPRPAREVHRVLVTLGGITRADLLAAIARVVRGVVGAAQIDVVVGPGGDSLDRVKAAVTGLEGVALHHAPVTLRPLMLEADLAVVAGGVTAYELAATATPAVALCLAENQRRNLAGLEAEGALVLAGDAAGAGLADRLERAVRALAADGARRALLAARARALVDGRGAPRVAERILARAGAARGRAGANRAAKAGRC